MSTVWNPPGTSNPVGPGLPILLNYTQIPYDIYVDEFFTVGDGTFDDGPAIRNAIIYATAQSRLFNGRPINLIFSGKQYRINNLVRTSATTNTHAYDGHGLVIEPDAAINFISNCPGGTRLCFYQPNGQPAATSYQLVGGAVWRGAGIFYKGTATGVAVALPKWLIGITLDGTCGANTGNNAFPANPTTGDGWDITNKGVWLENDRFQSLISLYNTSVTGFKGELVYNGGNETGTIAITGGRIGDTNGDCVSFSMTANVKGTELCNAAGNGIENFYCSGDSIFDQVRVHDVALAGAAAQIPASGTFDPLASFTIKNSLFRNCKRQGLLSGRALNLFFIDNILMDCGTISSGSGAIQVLGTSGSPQNCIIENNKIYADSLEVFIGIIFKDNGATAASGCRVVNNHCGRTPNAVAAGIVFQSPFSWSVLNTSDIVEYGNTAVETQFNFTQQRVVDLISLGAVSNVTLAQYRTFRNKLFTINAYVDVLLPCTITLNVRFYYTNGTSHDQLLISAVVYSGFTSVLIPSITVPGIADSESHYIIITASISAVTGSGAAANIACSIQEIGKL